MHLYEELEKYSCPDVKNLAWALLSPTLCKSKGNPTLFLNDDWCETQYKDYKPNLIALDKNPQPLLTTLARTKDLRLGNYFEKLFLFWLQNNEHYDLLLNNHPIRSPGKTLGEFDFIVKDNNTGETQHWETSVKFYLGTGDTSQSRNWHGPGNQDRLDLKYRHLCNQQILLAERPESKRELEKKNIHVDRKHIIIKGRLFYGPGLFEENKSYPAPLLINPFHLKGCWMTCSKFTSTKLPALSSNTTSIHRLQKTEWLTASIGSGHSYMDTKQFIAENPPSWPIQLLISKGSKEWMRMFIVPDQWIEH